MAVTLYVAGPLTGDFETNVQQAIIVGNTLMDLGLTIYLPHLSYYFHKQKYRNYEEWMHHCFIWITKCDALYRMPGPSPGADREVEYAFANEKPVFRTIQEVKQWALL
jgi:hypothetical protein